MDRCACCGGEFGPHPLELTYRGRRSVFCSFGCAVVQAAPACSVCGAKVLGRGLSAGGRTYCSSSCMRPAAVGT
jgi:hypothetical protein